MSTMFERSTFLLASSPLFVTARFQSRVEEFAISQEQVQPYLDSRFEVEYDGLPWEDVKSVVLPTSDNRVKRAVVDFVVEKAGFPDSPELVIEGLG